MKKQTNDPILLQIKSLCKKYKNLNRDNIRIIFQFCQYDYRRANRAICIINQIKNPANVIENLIKSPELSEEILREYELIYEKTYGPELQMETDKQQQIIEQKSIFQKLDYNFFEHIPGDCIMSIMSFLEPYSFIKFSLSCKIHYDIGRSEAQSQYYKNLCTKLFKQNTLILPFVCRFDTVRHYIMQNHRDFGPNIRNAVQNNLRKYIWKMEMNSVSIIEPSYYKSFGSYENLFKQCPRINYNGYYVCRDKYVRVGQKNQRNPVAPINIVYYYRYIRFLEDGSIIYHVRNRKLKQNQVLQFLAKSLAEQNDKKDTMIGEFIQFKEQVFLRAVKHQQIFSYQFEIGSNQGKISNQLKIVKYTLQIINEQHEIYQVLYAAHPNKEEKTFQYCHNMDLQEQNSKIARANSL